MVTFLAFATLIALLVDDPNRALTHALTAFVVLLAEDAARLRHRVDELETTVNEIIDS